MSALTILLAVGALFAAPAPQLTRDFLCKGCLAAGQDRGAPQPLIVVLHGDEGSPAKVAGLWAPLAQHGVCAEEEVWLPCAAQAPTGRRTFWLFAPNCPRSEGCAGSYWRWSGSPAWLLDKVARYSQERSVDPQRIYLAGWSGGASYIAMKAFDWQPTFAALSLAGGGTRPQRSECFPGTGGACGPVHFLMGSKNPLFSLAEEAKTGFERCGHALTWQLLPGVDHAGEWRAYSARAPAIAAWLLERPRGCVDASPTLAPLPSAAAPASVEAPTVREQPDPPAAVTPHPRGGCACDAARSSSGLHWAPLALGLSVLRSAVRVRSGERRLAEPRRSRA